MAALLPRLDFGTWNYGDVAFGLRSGLILNRQWISTIKTKYLLPQQQMFACLSLLLTLQKINSLSHHFPFIKHHSLAINLCTQSILALNIVAIVQRKIAYQKFSNTRTIFDKFLFICWKMTPYLALVTQIALFILEAKIRPIKGSAALLITAISLLDLTPWMPRSFGWYINVGIRLPIDIVAFYYGSNINRFRIFTGALMNLPVVQRHLQVAISKFSS